MYHILYASSECGPIIPGIYSAGMCGALPKQFNKEEWDIRIVLPDFSSIPAEKLSCFHPAAEFSLSADTSFRGKKVKVLEGDFDGITCYLIRQEDVLGSTSFSQEDPAPVIFFGQAILEMLPVLSFRPDIIQCFDWESAIVPAFLKLKFSTLDFYHPIRTIVSISDIRRQGIFPIDTIRSLTGFGSEVFTSDKLEFNGKSNVLKAGLVYADYITTVSSAFANEIQTYSYGEGLNGLLAARHMELLGILNGIDPDDCSPENDSCIAFPYGTSSRLSEKSRNKIALQKELGLKEDAGKYLTAFLAEPDASDGIEMILSAMEGIIDDYTQIVILGHGNPQYESRLYDFAWRYPEQVSVNIHYEEALKHRLFAAADSILLPSVYAPCNTIPMIAWRYGVVPIVRETGGFHDMIQAFNIYNNTGSGFSFRNYNPEEMLRIINYSKQIYYDRRNMWNDMTQRNMELCCTWKQTADNYSRLYRSLMNLS